MFRSLGPQPTVCLLFPGAASPPTAKCFVGIYKYPSLHIQASSTQLSDIAAPWPLLGPRSVHTNSTVCQDPEERGRGVGFAGNSEVLEGESAHPLAPAFCGQDARWRVMAGPSAMKGQAADPRPLAMGFSRPQALIAETAPHYLPGFFLLATLPPLPPQR